MRILHISDIHYRNKFSNNNVYESILSNMDSSLSKLNKLPLNDVDCICITGDLCDEGSAKDYQMLKGYFDKLKIPYFVCLGNHDDKLAFYEGWLDLFAVDEPYLCTNEFNGLNIISFDNSEYGQSDGYVDEYRINWLKENIKDNTIVLMHHQLYDLDGIPGLKNREALLEVLNDKRIIGVLNGHSHWFNMDGKYVTAPSISFRAKNENGNIVFYDCFGYCLLDVLNNQISLTKHLESQSKLLGKWNPKESKLY